MILFDDVIEVFDLTDLGARRIHPASTLSPMSQPYRPFCCVYAARVFVVARTEFHGSRSDSRDAG
jgi:hypothetical protein